MITINDIKNNKLVPSDYVGFIKEKLYAMETTKDMLYNSINKLNDEQEKQNNQKKIDDDNNRIIESI